jgi:hypothetical protein
MPEAGNDHPDEENFIRPGGLCPYLLPLNDAAFQTRETARNLYRLKKNLLFDENTPNRGRS